MTRLAVVVVIAGAAFVAAIAVFNTPGKRGCPLAADENSSYSSGFVGPVGMDETRHLVRVTHNGRPLAGARVCVNTEMVGMTGMGYSAKGHEVAPGRYRVGFQFGMPGKYRGNVVAKAGGREVSIPLLLDVGSTAGAMKSANKT